MNPSVLDASRRAMAQGSRSFYLASRLLPRPARASARLLYAWCRHCDDAIDAQVLGQAATATRPDGPRALALLVEASERALGEGPLDGPPFEALRQVVRDHDLPARYVREHLLGFAMDVAGTPYVTVDDTVAYSWRVAGVVGEMMAWVMGVRDRGTLDRAADLGIAFQLTNVARDVLDDARIGRVYLPGTWLREEGLEGPAVERPETRAGLTRVVARLLDEADRYYRSAEEGIRRLGPRESWSIESARRIYRAIGTEVRRRGSRAWDERVVVSPTKKLMLVCGAALEVEWRGRPPERLPPRLGLWPIPGSPD
jgi:phytoene synthase